VNTAHQILHHGKRTTQITSMLTEKFLTHWKHCPNNRNINYHLRSNAKQRFISTTLNLLRFIYLRWIKKQTYTKKNHVLLLQLRNRHEQ